MSIKFFKEEPNKAQRRGGYYKLATHYLAMHRELTEAQAIENPEIQPILTTMIEAKLRDHTKQLLETYTQAVENGDFEDDIESDDVDEWADEITEYNEMER